MSRAEQTHRLRDQWTALSDDARAPYERQTSAGRAERGASKRAKAATSGGDSASGSDDAASGGESVVAADSASVGSVSVSSVSVSSVSTPPTSDSENGVPAAPTDADLATAVQTLVSTGDLRALTKRKVKRAVSRKFGGVDLGARETFLNICIMDFLRKRVELGNY